MAKQPEHTFTDAAHLGSPGAEPWTMVNHPVYRGSTVLFPNLESFYRAYGQRYEENEYIYGRLGTPASRALQDAFCAMENGRGSVLTSCGLGAITTALAAFVESGRHILVSDAVYGPLRTFCDEELARLGVATTYYDPCIGGRIEGLLRPETKIIYLESPGSLTLEVQDIPAITKVARRRGVLTMADNTWATPVFFKPLNHGVDISIQAATKYIVGHSDSMLGIITANERCHAAIRRTAVNLGQYAAPDDVYLALRGLRTLPLRLARHQHNGLRLAEWLAARPEVRRVIHPGTARHPGHAIWKRDFSGASGLFSIIIEPCTAQALAAMIDGLRYFGLGASWGGYESLIMPVNPRTTRTAAEWREEGQLLRLHAGLENVDDLIGDLEAGFARLAQARR